MDEAVTFSTYAALYLLMKKLEIIAVVVLVLLLSAAIACNNAAESQLPHSMKGYELYSWQENGEWYFTLITGTNRNKTLQEIILSKRSVTEDGWVNLYAVGMDGIKDILSRVPEGEFVSWTDGHFVIAPENAEVTLELPPADIISEIKEHAEKCGLDFNVY